MRFLLVVVFGIFGWLSNSQGQSSFEEKLYELYDEANLPGFAVAIVNEEEIIYQKAFGFENIADKKPFSTETLLPIASISKTFLGMALMRAIELDIISLETPINDILPFKVINPKHPDIPITIAHLAEHTSSISDEDSGLKTFILKETISLSKGTVNRETLKTIKSWNKNHEQNLTPLLGSLLSKKGSNYKKKYFSKCKPGEKYEYSNLGIALLGLIVEIGTQESLLTFIEKEILLPLKLSNTGWIQSIQNKDSELAVGYFENRKEVPFYQGLLYPAGGMYSSCKDLTIFLQEHIKGYKDGITASILNQNSYNHLLLPHSKSSNSDAESRTYIWKIKGTKVSHNGGNYGTIVLMDFDNESKIGRIFMTNTSSYQSSKFNPTIIEIWELLNSQTIKE